MNSNNMPAKGWSASGGKKTNIIIYTFLAVVFIAVFYYIYSITPKTSDNIKKLQKVEVREYQGENLSSIGDFRENSIKGPQHIDIKDYKLEITGLVNNPMSFEYDEILNDYQSYQKIVTLNCVEGWNATILWEGILLKELLEKVSPKEEANTVIFYAEDGYSTAHPLDYLLDNDIMLAYKMNGVTLPEERGFPFQLVAESKWGYKWIKWITKIELSDDPEYRGYWESRGYSNSGKLDESFSE